MNSPIPEWVAAVVRIAEIAVVLWLVWCFGRRLVSRARSGRQ